MTARQDPWESIRRAAVNAGAPQKPDPWQVVKDAWADSIAERAERTGLTEKQVIGELIGEALLDLLAYRAARRGKIGLAVYWSGRRLALEIQRSRRAARLQAERL